jgi:hypothetical protein
LTALAPSALYLEGRSGSRLDALGQRSPALVAIPTSRSVTDAGDMQRAWIDSVADSFHARPIVEFAEFLFEQAFLDEFVPSWV